MRSIDETKVALEKAKVEMTTIDGDSDKLEEQRQEFQDYNRLSSMKKALILVLNEREQVELRFEIAHLLRKLADPGEEHNKELQGLKSQVEDSKREVIQTVRELEVLNDKVKHLENARDDVQEQLRDVTSQYHEALNVADTLKEALVTAREEQPNIQKAIQDIETEASSLKVQLSDADKSLDDISSVTKDLKDRLQETETKLKIYFRSRGRRFYFKTEEQKRKWISEEIQGCQKSRDSTNKVNSNSIHCFELFISMLCFYTLGSS